MTYALVGVIVVQAVALAAVSVFLFHLAREERKDLEDRLMAMTNLDAAILHNAQSKPVAGDVSYVDEAREWELSPGGGGGDGS